VRAHTCTDTCNAVDAFLVSAFCCARSFLLLPDRKQTVDFIVVVLQGTSNSADSEELRTRTLQAGHDVAVQYRELLQTVLHILSRPGGAADAKQNLPPISRRIAQCVTELVTSAELLKGSVCCPCVPVTPAYFFKLVLPCYIASIYILS
jgi:hypothetical protein